jgi:hypothetical protein
MVPHLQRRQHTPRATSLYNEAAHLLITMTGHFVKYSTHPTSGRTSVEKRNNTTEARTLVYSKIVTLLDQKAFKSLRM